MAKKLGGLGKGLNAIFIENDNEDKSGGVTLSISEIEPNRSQPRKEFDEKALSELAESISEHGLLQPLLVRPLPLGGYEIVAGERRYRACRMAGLTEVPVIIRELDEAQTMELALIENLQREDLTPLEEAEGYGSGRSCALSRKIPTRRGKRAKAFEPAGQRQRISQRRQNHGRTCKSAFITPKRGRNDRACRVDSKQRSVGKADRKTLQKVDENKKGSQSRKKAVVLQHG